jgi:hypothetical protein
MHDYHFAKWNLAKSQELLERLAAPIHKGHRLHEVHGDISEATGGLEICAALLPPRLRQ